MTENNTSLVRVELAERSYDIFVGDDSFSRISSFKALAGRKCLIVSDSNVWPLYSSRICEALESAGASFSSAVFTAGEESKTLETLGFLYDKAASAGLDRKSYIVALGGGVTGDLAGFAAATYMRGINFIQVPTTLLAMVDSSVGGKTGIDLPQGKNLAGAFWQPSAVFIDTVCLLSLPYREYICGLAEIVKYAVIMDSPFFDYLLAHAAKINKRDMTVLKYIIAKCCTLKADVVSKDEKESSLRAILNYGHTFGHAIEKAASFSGIAHGEAVSIGMMMAADLAVSAGIASSDLPERQKELLSALGLPLSTDFRLDAEAALSAMALDKKAESGKIRFVLPESIGKVRTCSVSDRNMVLNAIKKYSLH